LWIAFGLVSIALYFAHSMTFELRASDNRLASLQAEQAIEGAARYVSYLLANPEEPGKMPDLLTYQHEAAPVGEATFWFIGRDDRQQTSPTEPFFSLVDEASKLNLNTATLEMLQALPRMTPELAAAIIDWRDTNSDITDGGAESETYGRLRPPYNCKNAPFETVDELRLVYGVNMEILYGEDSNRNGILDANENDGDASLPTDNRDGRLDPGLLEYLTVYSRESNTSRTNVNNSQQLAALLQQNFTADRANQILQRVGGGQQPGGGGGGAGANTIRSVLEFYIRSQMTADEFAQIETNITASSGQYVQGLVNVNTASVEVLTCIPGIGTNLAPTLVSFRQSNPDRLTSLAWVAEVLDRNSAIQAGPYLTALSYQFIADIAAVGHHSRGYRRVRFVFDNSDTTPRILSRQDLTNLGWALGKNVRQQMLLTQATRP
jgi:DNA uptake protein ComE-like DNA-binding protein